MSRMIDALLQREPYQAPWDGPRKRGWWQEFSALAEDSPVIVIDNVADYVRQNGSVWSDWTDGFPNTAPPFHYWWMESRFPSTCPDDPTAIGGWFIAGRSATDSGWSTGFLPFIQKRAGVFGPLGVIRYVVSGEGLSEPVADGQFPKSMPLELADPVLTLLCTCMLAICFMHCKNVVIETNEPPAKLSKAHQKRHGKPLVRYHTLRIDPMKEILRREGGVEEHGLPKALHICRGHFATYSEERPLFGRVSGTFWKPMHVRGRASEGVVVKDYDVRAPRAA